jgi:hypothetical protein
VGISVGIGDPWTQVRAAITAGASSVELGFMGMGKGSIQSPTSVTPGTISREKREDIRQLAKINDVKLSTHASANAMGFSGLGEGKFSDQAAAQTMREVKRAIDFAADTAEGGAVVLHTGEFPRAISDVGEKFRMYEDEENQALAGMVNEKTGEILQAFKRDVKVPVLMVQKDKNNKPVIDPNTDKPVPLVDKNGRFKYEYEGYKDFENKLKEKGYAGEKLREQATRDFYNAHMQTQLMQTSSEEKRWFEDSNKVKKQLEHFQRYKHFVEEQAKKNPLMADMQAIEYAEMMRVAPPRDSEEYKKFLENPREYLEKGIEETKRQYEYMREATESYGKKKMEIEETMDKAVTIKEFAVKKSATNIAKLGMYALEVEKKKGLKKPVYISPENIFAEQYGSHPQELKELIVKARKQMAKDLQAKNMVSDPAKAKKVAEEHIKATFDIGHANLWRQYYEGSDKDFNKWLMGQVKDLVKSGVLGHVHISDNFGYGDEHLAPGQGNVPIKEFVKELEKTGLKSEIIIEPGAQGEGENIYGVLTGGWANLAASPMYRVGPVSKSWTDIDGSYFGRTNSPSLMQGQYLPISDKEEAWWSGVPLE